MPRHCYVHTDTDIRLSVYLHYTIACLFSPTLYGYSILLMGTGAPDQPWYMLCETMRDEARSAKFESESEQTWTWDMDIDQN